MFIKPLQKLPQVLIYKCPKPPIIVGYTYQHSGQPDLYRMVDIKTGKYVGEMIGAPILHEKHIKPKFYPLATPYRSFYIADLQIEERFMGYGRKFIEFAKALSKKSNCKGRVHLVASRIYDRYCPPHIFYKKCGFMSNNKFMNDYLDNCIALNCEIESEFADNLNMFLPVGDKIEKVQTKFDKIINFLKRFI